MTPYLVLAIVLAGAATLHFWWRGRCIILRDEADKARRALAEERQRHEGEDIQHKAAQSALFNSMAEGVLVLDANGRIQLVNRSLVKVFGLKSDVKGQTIIEAFRLQELVEVIERLPAETTVEGREIQLPGVNGSWLEVNAAAVRDSGGKQRGAILVFHELTRLKQLENTRQEFVGNVSHELRTPLSLIKGFVETLLDGAKDDPELSERFLRTIEKHADRLTYLIEDLLTISKLESGQIVMSRHMVEMREEATRVLEDLASRAAEKNVALRNEVPAGLQANADSDRLQQVLFNLVENAIKYGRSSGEVKVGGREARKGMAEMWVKDDGPGIPEDAQERVFERFYRVDRARSRETGGTGLGLSIVKHIVQAHGGEVRLTSETGKGATFYFTLPQE